MSIPSADDPKVRMCIVQYKAKLQLASFNEHVTCTFTIDGNYGFNLRAYVCTKLANWKVNSCLGDYENGIENFFLRNSYRNCIYVRLLASKRNE